MKQDFLNYFENLPGIDLALTNHALINALFDFRQSNASLVIFGAARGSGVTTTFTEYAKWLGDRQLTVIAADFGYYRQNGINAYHWRAHSPSKHGASFYLVDSPLDSVERQSVQRKSMLEDYICNLSRPVFYAKQNG